MRKALEPITKNVLVLLAGVLIALASGSASADDFSDTVELFKNAGQSAAFFQKSYGYAVFPTVGEGGLVVGGAHGSGKKDAATVGSTTTRAWPCSPS